jgi:hypothetical protein
VDNNSLLGQRRSGKPYPRQDRRQHHCGSALHIIVEGANLIGVALEDPGGVGRAEVLPMQQGVREQLAHRRNESVYELVVAFTANPCMAIAQVKWIIQEVEVVRTNI